MRVGFVWHDRELSACQSPISTISIPGRTSGPARLGWLCLAGSVKAWEARGWVASSSAAWRWSSWDTKPAIAKAFGLDDATRQLALFGTVCPVRSDAARRFLPSHCGHATNDLSASAGFVSHTEGPLLRIGFVSHARPSTGNGTSWVCFARLAGRSLQMVSVSHIDGNGCVVGHSPVLRLPFGLTLTAHYSVVSESYTGCNCLSSEIRVTRQFVCD